MDLKIQLEKAAAETNDLKAKLNHQQEELRKHSNENIDAIDQKDKLLEILIRKDNTIKSMSSQIDELEIRLQSSVKQKLNAVACLEAIEAKELTLTFKEKQMNSDVERLNSNVRSLQEELNKNVMELMAARQELKSAVVQFEMEMKEKSEQLRIANFNVSELSKTNEKLKIQNVEYEHKLQDQLNKSGKVMKAYDNELKAKTELVRLYKENCVDYEAQIEEFTAGVVELQKLLNETVDMCGILETRLKECELKKKALSDANNEIITKLKQELNDANRLLNGCEGNNESNKENDDKFGLTLKEGLTFTEVYTRYCEVVNELQKKAQENKILEMEMSNLIIDIKEKAKNFEAQQNELEKHKASNKKLIEERNTFHAEVVVAREELESRRIRCELLKNENDNLKFYGNEYLKIHFSLPSNKRPNLSPDFPTIPRRSSSVVEKQNQELMVHTLNDKNYDRRDDNGNVVDTCVSSSTNVCNKSVAVTEDDFIAEGILCSTDTSNMKMQTENLIQELTENNTKLQNEVRELNSKKELLVAEANLSSVRNAVRQQQFQSLEKQNQVYVGLIDDSKIANKYLRNENTNAKKQLFQAEDRLEHLLKERTLLLDIKKTLTSEVELLKRELSQEKHSNQILRSDLAMMKAYTERSKIETQLKIDNADCQALLQTKILQREVDRCQSAPSCSSVKASSDIPSNLTRYPTIRDVSQGNKKKFLHSLQLTKSETVAPKCSSSVPDVVNLKACSGPSQRLRSNKKARVLFVDLSGDSDKGEIINVSDDNQDRSLPDIESKLLSEVRTRKQARFIHDAFHW